MSSPRVVAARVDGASVHTEHVLAGAQRMAAQDAEPNTGDAAQRMFVVVGDRRCRGREADVGARLRWFRQCVAVRWIIRVLGVADGCLRHGCSTVRMQPAAESAAQDARRVTGEIATTCADRTHFATRGLPRIVSTTCAKGLHRGAARLRKSRVSPAAAARRLRVSPGRQTSHTHQGRIR
jgi:hypothetical protein